MRGYNPYAARFSALALFIVPLLHEGVCTILRGGRGIYLKLSPLLDGFIFEFGRSLRDHFPGLQIRRTLSIIEEM